MRARAWALRVAKKSGMSEQELLRVYKMYVRPIAEANSPVIQPMINALQSYKLERQQTLAMSIIYGSGISGAKMLNRAGVKRLVERRKAACITFTKKAINNPRFREWFKERPQAAYGRRGNKNYKKYEEQPARTERRYNTPKYYYRRLANELQL